MVSINIPKPVTPKAPKKTKKGSASKTVDNNTLVNYVLTGGKLTDLKGKKISQNQVLDAITANPQLLSSLGALMGQQFGQTGNAQFDPNANYASGPASFEASFNPVKDKYSNLSGVEGQIASDFFDSIDAGTDPAVAASNLSDSKFLKANYGVDIAQVAGTISGLSADANKYVTASQKQKVAGTKQQYDAWLKNVQSTGATPSDYLAKVLGVPALANLPDPTSTFAPTAASIRSSDQFRAGLPRNMQGNVGADGSLSGFLTPDELTSISGLYRNVKDQSVRPSAVQQFINKNTFDVNNKSNYGLPFTDQTVAGTGWLRNLINRGVQAPIGVTAASVLSGSKYQFNPFDKKAYNTENSSNVVAADKAKQEAMRNVDISSLSKLRADSQERVLTIVKKSLDEQAKKLQQQGITPFTIGVNDLRKIIGSSSSLPIVKK